MQGTCLVQYPAHSRFSRSFLPSSQMGEVPQVSLAWGSWDVPSQAMAAEEYGDLSFSFPTCLPLPHPLLSPMPLPYTPGSCLIKAN